MKLWRWSLILFSFVWLNVVLPGHTRGAIQLPGTTPACHSSKPVESKKPHCCEEQPSKEEKPSKDPSKCCAVCFFAARLTLPPVFTIDLSLLCRREIAPAPPSESLPVSLVLLSHPGRSPPAV